VGVKFYESSQCSYRHRTEPNHSSGAWNKCPNIWSDRLLQSCVRDSNITTTYRNYCKWRGRKPCPSLFQSRACRANWRLYKNRKSYWSKNDVHVWLYAMSKGVCQGRTTKNTPAGMC
jgi:hypothetical protein